MCGHCGIRNHGKFQIDHIVRLGEGGSDDISNLMALCVECHAEKTLIEVFRWVGLCDEDIIFIGNMYGWKRPFILLDKCKGTECFQGNFLRVKIRPGK